MSNSSEAIGQTTTQGKRPHSKILVDGGDPEGECVLCPAHRAGVLWVILGPVKPFCIK
jgi:hypothetical protein